MPTWIHAHMQLSTLMGTLPGTFSDARGGIPLWAHTPPLAVVRATCCLVVVGVDDPSAPCRDAYRRDGPAPGRGMGGKPKSAGSDMPSRTCDPKSIGGVRVPLAVAETSIPRAVAGVFPLRTCLSVRIGYLHLASVAAPQGCIWGRRCGASPAIGRTARRAAGFVPRRDRNKWRRRAA